jgi:hypothetical protein
MGIFKDRRPPDPPVTPKPSPTGARRLPSRGEIESAIDEAMRTGQFDNLPGHGKPFDPAYLNGDPDYFAEKLLKDQGFVPEWLRLGRALDQLEDELEAAFRANEAARLHILLERRNDAARRFNQKAPMAWQQRGILDAASLAAWAERRQGARDAD